MQFGIHYYLYYDVMDRKSDIGMIFDNDLVPSGVELLEVCCTNKNLLSLTIDLACLVELESRTNEMLKAWTLVLLRCTEDSIERRLSPKPPRNPLHIRRTN